MLRRVPLPRQVQRHFALARHFSCTGAALQTAPSRIQDATDEQKQRIEELRTLRHTNDDNIKRMAEVQQAVKFQKALETGVLRTSHANLRSLLTAQSSGGLANVTNEDFLRAVDAAMLTFLLHVESRVMSLMGKAFYTIGPCGEELLAPLGMVLRPDDPSALHYRHVAVQVARQLHEGRQVEDILLDRARGYVVSANDPVTGGAHCCIGGTPYDYVVTSTLASQTTPAVGRALGSQLAYSLNIPGPFTKTCVSLVSLGDGSTTNGHFLSGVNFAQYATGRHSKVPVVFCVTDNGICISLKTHGCAKRYLKRTQLPMHVANGQDMVDVWAASRSAFAEARSAGRPVVLYIENIVRRFGHAATDRQLAYLPMEDVSTRHDTCMLSNVCQQAIDAGLTDAPALRKKFDNLWTLTREAFELASLEPKITSREAVIARNSRPLIAVGNVPAPATPPVPTSDMVHEGEYGSKGKDSHTMRKHMTAVFDELMATYKDIVYIGEDVEHGGYYLVTENLAKKFRGRVLDFPPDETSLVGVGMGFSQAGMVPIVEIPYAKYLDCGMDIFAEAAIMSWLTEGRQTNGMVVRLQGFDRGVFGGNYHTHNMLSLPPGVDVVCCANGRDYARLMRYAVAQARNGRMSMFVDCTALLNQNKVYDGAIPWEFPYTASDEYRGYDDVTVYDYNTNVAEVSNKPGLAQRGSAQFPIVIVSYGNGVVTAIEAMHELRREHNIHCRVVDSPILSTVSDGLRDIVLNYVQHTPAKTVGKQGAIKSAVAPTYVFADICKETGNPLASHMAVLQNECDEHSEAQNTVMRCVAAPKTYNPLGNTLTFLNREDVVAAVLRASKIPLQVSVTQRVVTDIPRDDEPVAKPEDQRTTAAAQQAAHA